MTHVAARVPTLVVGLGTTRNKTPLEILRRLFAPKMPQSGTEPGVDRAKGIRFIAMPGVPIRDIQPFRGLNAALLKRRITKWLREQGCSPEQALLWVGVPTDYALDMVREFRGVFSVYDVAQVYSQSEHMPATVAATEAQLVRQVNLTLCDSVVVSGALGAVAADAPIVPQGVDVDLFRDSARVQRRRVVGYVGSENQAFDTKLMREVVGALPSVQFELAGEFSRVWESANVRVLGPIAHRDLPAILGSWSVGIVPYKENAFTAGVLPTKVLEYIAAGLPVVSTGLAALQAMCWTKVMFAQDAATFIRHIADAVEADGFEDPDWAWLESQSWDARFADVERELMLRGVCLSIQ